MRLSPTRRRIVLALCACAALRGVNARAADDDAPTDADWAAMKKVIADQLAALRKGDAERAFSYAADGIRAQLGSADAFMAMVQSGYGALLTARYTEFLEGAVIDGAVIQPLRLVAPDNTVRVALYTMQRVGTRWRIAGCAIAPSTVKAA